MCYWIFKAKLKLESRNKNKIQYCCQAVNLIVTSLKITRLLFIHTSNVLLKFGLEVKLKLESRNRKAQYGHHPPGSHFESEITDNQHASVHSHKQHAYEIWNLNSKANLSYIPETLSPTDGQTDSQTRWIQYTPQYNQLRWLGELWFTMLWHECTVAEHLTSWPFCSWNWNILG